ncbi:segmentation protein cap'n'collar isoform X3 [Lutzomyia longipalpis]|uniref:segmentation protein cap'n'collar isoform X3 n=1 Tax=Lutzomyia longipalpis TaxID=7200 RepID=UPI0024842909|nr:segmentation protein cap'n'collar isoform X3 [Lutzomyia longipalpis]
MISLKKIQADRLLQVALVLSLLRVDPSNYLGYGWESQLALQDGDGWQLELRAATPFTDIHHYSNRKAVIPLIEDLVRFNHNSNDVTAYLLNSVHHTNHTSGSGQNFTGSASASASDTPAAAAANATVGQRTPSGEENPPATAASVELDELFLTPFADSATIYDENLANLTEFGETIASVYPYLGLPTKDELLLDSLIPPEPPSIDDFALSGASNYGMPDSPAAEDFVEWEDFYGDSSSRVTVKTEPQEVPESPATPPPAESADATVKTDSDECESSSSVVLTPEESELIEVLWKQDVDLGFSLAPPSTSLKKEESHSAEDDAEKLNALLELKNEKNDSAEKDEGFDHDWPNLPIDAETGEYIQKLPLQLDDSLLQEALHQLEDLSAEQDALKDDSFDFEPKREPLDSISSASIASDGGEEVKSPLDREETFDLSDVKSDDTNELEELLCDMMIQSSSAPFQHPRSVQGYGHGVNSFRQSSYHHQPRVPLSRAVSMEQRWQDLANLLSLSPGMGVGMGVGDIPSHPHYSSHYPYQPSAPSIPQHSQFTHPHSHPAVLHNASLSDLGAAGQPHYGPNLGSAVASSMHLTNSSSETDGGASGYKMDPDILYYSNTSSEINSTTDGFLNSILNDEDLQLMDIGINEGMYTMRMLDHNSTSNNSTATNGGLGSSISGASGGLGNSGGLLGMQTNLNGIGGLAGAHGDRLDTSSDSAVSSMGSERVPSLSDGEWGDAGSDSAQEYQSKYGGPYDYSYSGRLGESGGRAPPVAQKKHHMFAKRYFQEQNTSAVPPSLGPQTTDTMPPTTGIKYEYDQYSMGPQGASGGASGPHGIEAGAMGTAAAPLMNSKSHHLAPPLEIKYSCSHDFAARHGRGGVHDIVSHNHTYTLPQSSGVIPKPQTRDKKAHKKSEEEHLTRDEKRAKALGIQQIPMPVCDIINLPMDEFNERLSKHELSETQLSLIRDIRRRGKNKVAAQNCRKRKLDQILSLADEVKEVRNHKSRLIHDRDSALMEQKRVMDKFTALYRHVFQYMRDQDGNPYSSSQYSLQLSADGSVYLLPREPKTEGGSGSGSGPSNSHHSHQQKE